MNRERIMRILRARTFKESPTSEELLNASISVIAQMANSDEGVEFVRDRLFSSSEFDSREPFQSHVKEGK